jgi:WD40 repeat protein
MRLDVVFAPDSRHVLTGDGDQCVRIWDVETGKMTLTSERGPARVGIAVSPDGKLIASHGGLENRVVDLLDASTGQVVRTLTGHTLGVRDVAFSSDSRRLLSASSDRTVRIWDVAAGKELLKLDHRHMVGGVALSPDGKRLASTANLWLTLWDVDTAEKIKETEIPGSSFGGPAYSKDGRHLLTVQRLRGSEPSGFLVLWEAETLTIIRRFEGHTKGIRSAVFSPDGRMIVSGSGDKTLRVWDVQTGREIARHEADNHYTNHVAVSPDGRYIVCGGGQYTEGRKPLDDGDHALRLFRLPK